MRASSDASGLPHCKMGSNPDTMSGDVAEARDVHYGLKGDYESITTYVRNTVSSFRRSLLERLRNRRLTSSQGGGPSGVDLDLIGSWRARHGMPCPYRLRCLAAGLTGGEQLIQVAVEPTTVEGIEVGQGLAHPDGRDEVSPRPSELDWRRCSHAGDRGSVRCGRRVRGNWTARASGCVQAGVDRIDLPGRHGMQRPDLDHR